MYTQIKASFLIKKRKKPQKLPYCPCDLNQGRCEHGEKQVWDAEWRVAGWQEKRWKETPKSNFIHVWRGNQDNSVCKQWFFIISYSFVNSKASPGFCPVSQTLGPSTLPAMHLGASWASFVRLKQGVKPFSIYFIPRMLRQAGLHPYAPFTHMSGWGYGLIFHSLIRRYELTHNLLHQHHGINIFSD